MVGDYEKPKEPSTEVENMVGHASLFSQMLSIVDRHRFARLVREHKAIFIHILKRESLLKDSFYLIGVPATYCTLV